MKQVFEKIVSEYFSRHRILFGIAGVIVIILTFSFIMGSGHPVAKGEEVNIDRQAMKNSSDSIELINTRNRVNTEGNAKMITVEKALICVNVDDMSPVGAIRQIPPDIERIFCWARVLEAKGEKIRYLWYFNGTVVTSNWQVILSDRFITWCPYRFNTNAGGKGHVDIVNSRGKVLKRIQFEVMEKQEPTRVRLKRS
ncbi:MAG: hypothetical protein HY811_07165 [Planctomycetes bacterium]|nr:hypothetical protein [Planctomycetota bacterium]